MLDHIENHKADRRTIDIANGTVSFFVNYENVLEKIKKLLKALIIDKKRVMGCFSYNYPSYDSDTTLASTQKLLNEAMLAMKHIEELMNSIEQTFKKVIKTTVEQGLDPIACGLDEYSSSSLIGEFIDKFVDVVQDTTTQLCRIAEVGGTYRKKGGSYCDQSINALNSTVYIVAPSVAALSANEAAYQRSKAQSDKWSTLAAQEYYNQLEEMKKEIPIFERACDSLVEIGAKTLEQIVDRVKRQLFIVEGKAASEKKWQTFSEAPDNKESYVLLLSNCQSVEGVSDIAEAFGIKKNDLYSICCDTFNRKLGNQEISILLSTEKRLIENMETYFQKNKADIIKDLLTNYSNHVISSLSVVCNALPDNIKKNLPPKKQAAQVSGRLINSIITVDNYLLLSRVFGAEWIEKIKQACHLEGSSESPYEQITKNIFRRICIANDYTAEKATTLSKLEEQKIAFEKELKNKGFFAFAEKRQLKQQLADVEQNIEKAKEDYEMKLEML